MSPYPGFERMHCQKSLKGPGTVLNGFPSKQAYAKYMNSEEEHINIDFSKKEKLAMVYEWRVESEKMNHKTALHKLYASLENLFPPNEP